jgi:hypothetical protein
MNITLVENIKLNFIDNNENDNNDNNDNLNLSFNEDKLLELFHNFNNYNNKQNIDISQIDYYKNYTLKEIMLICDYYEITKYVKTNKYNKLQTISFLIQFESSIKNFEIVKKRKTLWMYINELKKDKFIQKYILL